MAKINGSFSADIADFVAVSEKRMIALMRQSVQDVILDAQTPVGKGGRMRVDTGFLRASGQSSLNGMPVGPTRGELTKPGSYEFDPNTVQVTLGTLEIGMTFHFGWTANYARYREVYDGFLSGAAQRWSEYVDKNTETIRQRITK